MSIWQVTTPGLYIILGATGRFLRWLPAGPQPGQEIPENGTSYVVMDERPPCWDGGRRGKRPDKPATLPTRRKRDTGMEAVIRKALKQQKVTGKGG